MISVDHLSTHRIARDADRDWFEAQIPPRRFRCRKAEPFEFRGTPPDGKWPFVIIGRSSVSAHWTHDVVLEPTDFDPNLSDVEIHSRWRAGDVVGAR